MITTEKVLEEIKSVSPNINFLWNISLRIFPTNIIILCLKRQTNDWFIKQAIFQNVAERPFNIRSILNNFKSLIGEIYEKGYTQKFNKKKDENNYFKDDSSQR